MKTRNTLFWLLLLTMSGGACSSANDPAGSGLPSDTDRETPSNLVARWLPYAVASRDSAGLEESLDEAFAYPGAGGEDPAAKEDVLRYLGRALTGHPDERGRTLAHGDLVVIEKGTFLDDTPYEGKPDGEKWYKSSVSVDLLLVFDGTDGRTTDSFDEEMFLVVRPDPENDDLWVVIRAELADPLP
ncbi:MAG: hypothetical protein ABIK65_07210 [Candidatus Eisenbacteria bacterium]